MGFMQGRACHATDQSNYDMNATLKNHHYNNQNNKLPLYLVFQLLSLFQKDPCCETDRFKDQ